MGKFISPAGVTFSVDDSKDDRYLAEGNKPEDEKKAPAKKSASSKSEK